MLGHAHLAGKVSLFCLLDSSLVFVFSFQNRFLHPFKRFHGRKSRIKARDFSPSVWMDAGGGRQGRTDQVEGRSQRVTSRVIKTLNPGAFSLWPQDERMFQSPPPPRLHLVSLLSEEKLPRLHMLDFLPTGEEVPRWHTWTRWTGSSVFRWQVEKRKK